MQNKRKMSIDLINENLQWCLVTGRDSTENKLHRKYYENKTVLYIFALAFSRRKSLYRKI